MTVQAELVAVLVDEWVRAGVRHAVVAPGSRSAPLALALLADERLRVEVRLDERSAAFSCLGIGLASGMPAILCTTSGTAAVEAHPAVVEASLAGVPMIVCTADRPLELHRVGAPQTVEQQHLYGPSVRAFLDLGAVMSDEAPARASWRSLASRVVADALASPLGPGPVQVNLPLREPLLGEAGELPPGRPDGRPWHRAVACAGASPAAVEALLDAVAGASRGVIVAGAGAGAGAGAASPAGAAPASGAGGDTSAEVLALARALGWPVLADPRAWPKLPAEMVVEHPDAVLRSDLARRLLAPEVILHLGAPHASKVLASWWAEPALAGTRHVLVDPYGRFADPERLADLVLVAEPAELCRQAAGRLAAASPPAASSSSGAASSTRSTAASTSASTSASTAAVGYLERWQAADRAAAEAIAGLLEGGARWSEPAAARALFACLPPGSALVASSSMPVRDVEWFAAARAGAPQVLANRGANGIDGVVSTALGAALAVPGRRTVALVGDLAFLHDVGALVHGRAEVPPELTVVVLDNSGGGIFSFLSYADALPDALYERAFGTPQGADLAAVASALRWRAYVAVSRDDLLAAIEESGRAGGPSVILVPSAREANRELHAELADAAASAVDKALAEGPPIAGR